MRHLITGLTGLAAMAMVTAARAQIGNGWTPAPFKRAIQIESHGKYQDFPYVKTFAATEGASYERTNDTEIFKLFNHDASNRVEIRDDDAWKTGQRQFEGDLRALPPTDRESCMQVFGRENVNGKGGPVCMLWHFATNGGTFLLFCGNYSTNLITGIDGQWVHVNVIHNADSNTVTAYINGEKKCSFAAPKGDPSGQYFKYGCYGTLKTETSHIEWRNVKFFQKR